MTKKKATMVILDIQTMVTLDIQTMVILQIQTMATLDIQTMVILDIQTQVALPQEILECMVTLITLDHLAQSVDLPLSQAKILPLKTLQLAVALMLLTMVLEYVSASKDITLKMEFALKVSPARPTP